MQALGKGKLSTNLLPREIVADRLIRDKKPWAVGLVAAILLGCSISFLGHWRAWRSAQVSLFTTAISQADAVKTKSKKFTDDYQTNQKVFQDFDQMGKNIVGGVEGRLLWIEVLKAIDYCLPHDPDGRPKPKDIRDRNELHITEVECEHRADLATWYTEVQSKIDEANRTAGGGAAAAPCARRRFSARPRRAVRRMPNPATPNPAVPNPAALPGVKPAVPVPAAVPGANPSAALPLPARLLLPDPLARAGSFNSGVTTITTRIGGWKGRSTSANNS